MKAVELLCYVKNNVYMDIQDNNCSSGFMMVLAEFSW